MAGLLQSLDKKKELTEKQVSFLGYLVETNGDAKLSAELAGYSGNHYQILRSLKEEVLELTTDVLAQSAPKAAFKILEMMNTDQTIPQANIKLQAAQTVLDRVGISKSEKLDINLQTAGGIFIMPDKAPIEVEAEEVEYIDDEEE